MFNTNTSLSACTARSRQAALVGLLSFMLWMNQTASGASSVSNQLKTLPTGTMIQVHMASGKILRGELVSSTGSTFDLLDSDDHTISTINSIDVKAVDKTKSPSRQKRSRAVNAIWIGALVAATGIAVGLGGVY
jgi:hypothetical protein